MGLMVLENHIHNLAERRPLLVEEKDDFARRKMLTKRSVSNITGTFYIVNDLS